MIAGSEVTAVIEHLRPLTQEQRQGARKNAREGVLRAIGPKPAREHFNQSTPSAIRLYVIGSQTFGQAVSNDVAMTAVGFATVLSAEVGQIVFSLALATCRFQCNIGMEYGENCQNQPLRGRKIPA
jgi:hypothetical protein